MHRSRRPHRQLCLASLLGLLALAATAQASEDSLEGPFLPQRQLVREVLRGNPRLLDAGLNLRTARLHVGGAPAPYDWRLEAGTDLRQSLNINPFSPDQLRTRTSFEAYTQLARRLRTGTELRLRLAESFTEYPVYGYSGFPSSLELTIPGEAIGAGQADITFPIRLRTTDPPGPTSFATYATASDFSVTQPILQGTSVAVLDGPELRARSELRRAQARRQQLASEVLSRVLQLAAELTLARTDRSLRLAARDLALRELEVTRAKIAAGQQAPVAELQIRQTVAEREEAGLLAERAIRDLDVELRRALGESVVPGAAPLDPEPLRLPHPDAEDPEALLRRALEHNPEIQVARLAIEDAQLGLRSSQDRLLPRLDASAGLGVLAQDPDGLSAWQRLFTAEDGFNWHLGLLFSMPLGNRDAETRVEEARLGIERARAGLTTAEAGVRVELAKSLDAMRVARKRIQVGELSRNLAARTAEGEVERYHLGLATTYDLLEAQERLRAAEFSLQRARHDLALAELRLLSVTGLLLQACDVQVLPAVH